MTITCSIGVVAASPWATQRDHPRGTWRTPGPDQLEERFNRASTEACDEPLFVLAFVAW